MIREAGIVLDARAEDIFAAIVDLNQWPQWLPVLNWPDGMPGALAQGARFRCRLTLLGVTDTVRITVTENQPPHQFAFLAEGNYGSDLNFGLRIEPATGTRSRIHMTFDITGRLPRPLAVIANRAAEQMLKRALRQFSEQFRRASGGTSPRTSRPPT
jgi:hypothetical protein